MMVRAAERHREPQLAAADTPSAPRAVVRRVLRSQVVRALCRPLPIPPRWVCEAVRELEPVAEQAVDGDVERPRQGDERRPPSVAGPGDSEQRGGPEVAVCDVLSTLWNHTGEAMRTACHPPAPAYPLREVVRSQVDLMWRWRGRPAPPTARTSRPAFRAIARLSPRRARVPAE